jgi:ATP-binding cassette subfamily B protein
MDMTKAYPKLRKKVILLSLANGIEDITPPLILGLAVDTITLGPASLLGKIGLSTVGTRILTLAGFGVTTWLLAAIIEYVNDRSKAQLANAVRHDLRLQLYNHLQTLDISEIESREVSEWIAVLEVDINQIHDFIRNGTTPFFNVATNVFAVAIIFLLVSPGFALLQLLMIPPLIFASKVLLKPIRTNFLKAYDDGVSLSSMMSGNIAGMSTIYSFNSQEVESLRIQNSSNQFTNSMTKAEQLEAIYVPTLRMIAGTGFLTSIVWGGIKVGSGTLSTGALNTMALTQLRLLSAIARLGYGLDMYQKTINSIAQINDVLEIKPKILSGSLKKTIEKIEGEIVFDNVTFGYDQNRPVIKNLSFSIPPKKMIGIVGLTGAGKSTIIKLLMRFYDPNAGKISVDGINIKDYSIDTLRESMALVSQNVTLFSGTIFENIAYGKKDASLDEVIAAAKVAEAHDFIMDLPKQYESTFGYGGFNLSGGQRQRLAIARAILVDRPILLLDEATSSLDFETEASFQRSLRVATQNKTTIVIAHRLATIRNADIIFVLKNGSISEKGTHAELLQADETYAGMWKIQTGEQLDILT